MFLTGILSWLVYMMKKTRIQKLCGKQIRIFHTKAVGIYRKGPKDTRHKFLMSVNSDVMTFQDNLLSAGETAEYFVRIRYEDGRATTNSNIVTVTANKQKAE